MILKTTHTHCSNYTVKYCEFYLVNQPSVVKWVNKSFTEVMWTSVCVCTYLTVSWKTSLKYFNVIKKAQIYNVWKSAEWLILDQKYV